jgi:hypothetical protein
MDANLLARPRVQEAFAKIDADDALSYRLPRAGATAGAVIAHAQAVFEGVHVHLKPLTYKFGFTHDPHFRYYNSKFGYTFGPDKFEKLIAVYCAADPTGPAFLEAALVKLYEGRLATCCPSVFPRLVLAACMCRSDFIRH